jgi:glutamine amidotransferase
MCRVIAYMGKTTKMHPFTHDSYNSLIKQSTKPQLMSHSLNLSGNGIAGWRSDKKTLRGPILYRSKTLPMFDENLEMVARMIDLDCFIAHIRGGPLNTGTVLSDQNAHPFFYPNAGFALAHNGGLRAESLEKEQHLFNALAKEIHPVWFKQMRGTTDSEYIYALILTILDKFKDKKSMESVQKATCEALLKIKKIREKFKITEASPVNLFISNGEFIIIIRYTYNFGEFSGRINPSNMTFYSLWYTYGDSFIDVDGGYHMIPGKSNSICFASEPLSKNIRTWLEVPEYSMMSVVRGAPIKMKVQDLDF